MTIKKVLSVQQVKRALLMFYGKGQKYKYTCGTVNAAVENNWTNVSNVCPAGIRSTGKYYGFFAFKYIGNKQFECSTTFPELLNA